MTRLLAAGILIVFSLQTRPSEIATLTTTGPASLAVFAKTGKLAAAITGQTRISLWSLPDGKAIRDFDMGGQIIDTLALSDDGRWLAAGSHAGRYRVWNASTGKQQMQLEMAFYPFALSFSPGGSRLAIAAAGQPAKIYDPASGRKLLELHHAVGGVVAVVFSRDGGRIATADAD